MKYLKLFENFNQSEIDEICRKYGITNYKINLDGSIDVVGNVYLIHDGLTEIPLKFNKVSGSFGCAENQLTNLEGCPKEVGGYFDCSYNKLTSLEWCPNHVDGSFYCHNNNLTSLVGCPNYVGGNFYCYNNKLTNLIGCPNTVGDLNCYCNNLTTLEGYPEEIDGDIWITDNPIYDVVCLFNCIVRYLEYQETYNFIRKDGKIVRHLLEEALKDFNEYYNRNYEYHNKDIELPEKIEGYTYI
jgi:hypothetical protein